MPDAHKNFAVSAVATAPSPATSGTSLVVTTGHGTRFPTPPFNATIWPASSQPDPTNAEIVRVTGIATDTLTIARAQESTSARTVVVGDQIAATITAKTLTDIEAVIGPGSGATVVGTAEDIGASPISIPVITGTQDGDLVVFAGQTVNSIPNSGGPTAGGGTWNQLIRFDTSSNEFHFAYWKIASSESGNWQITHSAGDEVCAAAAVYRGVDTLWTSDTSLNSYRAPSILGHPDGLQVIVWFTAGTGGSNMTVPGGVTLDEFVESATTNKAQVLIAHADTYGQLPTVQHIVSTTADVLFSGAASAVFYDA